eukprot:768531-Hanusia_phi.AAC.8
MAGERQTEEQVSVEEREVVGEGGGRPDKQSESDQVQQHHLQDLQVSASTAGGPSLVHAAYQLILALAGGGGKGGGDVWPVWRDPLQEDARNTMRRVNIQFSSPTHLFLPPVLPPVLPLLPSTIFASSLSVATGNLPGSGANARGSGKMM